MTTETENGRPLETVPKPDGPVEGPRSRRIRWIALGVLGAIVIGGLATAQGTRTGSEGPGPGGTAAASPFTLENLQPGQPPVSLKALRGKPVVVNFWASWCVPCRREMPALQGVHEALGDRVAFVGIDNKDYRKDALDLVKKTGVRYPSGFDPGGAVAADYGLVGMPTTIFISADGRLLDRRVGEMSADELRSTISRLYGIS